MQYFGHQISNKFRAKTPKGFYDEVKGHTGIDLLMPIGTPLSLPVFSKVEKVLKQTEMGTTLYLSVGNEILVFAHLSEVLYSPNDDIPPGYIFARSGNSGTKTTAPHLHLEVLAPKPEHGAEMMSRTLGGFKGYNIDPATYLDSLAVTPFEEAHEWAMKHGLITKSKLYAPDVRWDELLPFAYRLTKKIVEWVK